MGALLAAMLLMAACADDESDTSSGDDVVEDDAQEVAEVDEVDVELDTGTDDEIADSSGEQLDISDATFYEGECPFEVEVEVEVDCGWVEVPESREGLSDATIEIAIAILRTPVEDPAPDPVVYLAGGPGGAALLGHSGWLGSLEEVPFHAVLSTRDMILVDQRGTGFSVPSLDCADEEAPEDCYQRLVDEGVTMAAYSTPENAADIASIRVALGLEEWNIYGSSYGTRLGLVTLDNHPEGIRSVLLAGVYPPDTVPAYNDYMDNTFRFLDALASECRRQDACNAAYGDIEQLLVEALEVTESGPSEFFAQDLFDKVFGAMYAMETASLVPQALWLAADGDIDEAMALLDGEGAGAQVRSRLARVVDPSEDDDSAGLFNSVECREEQAFTDLEALEVQAQGYLDAGVSELLVSVIFDGAKATTETVCPLWDSGLADDEERDPTVSDVPTLLLSGEFDPITPPAWGDLAAESLSSSTHVVVPSLSHTLINVDQCIDDIVIEFFGDPTSELATDCVAEMTTIEFPAP